MGFSMTVSMVLENRAHTTLNFFTATKDLKEALNDKDQVDIIILDFSKGIWCRTSSSSEQLSNRLQSYGIINKTLAVWIESFFTGRSERVVLESQTSSNNWLRSGIGHGLGTASVLSYINDLPDTLSSTTNSFTDDCLLYRCISSPEGSDALQLDLEHLFEWQKKWQMDYNASKCYVMNISRSRLVS